MTTLKPPKRPAPPARVTILRSLANVGTYLESLDAYALPQQQALDLDDWLKESGDADQAAFENAVRLRIPLAKPEAMVPAPELLRQLPPDEARRIRAVPLLASAGKVAVALERPDDPDALDRLDFLLADRVVPLAAGAHAVSDAIARHYDSIEDAAMVRQLGLGTNGDAENVSEHEMERLASEQPVVRTVTQLIAAAVARRASDIHLRPGEHGLEVLYRIDDELVPVRRFARALQPAMVSRIKVIAGMNLAEHRRPQDGRTTFVTDQGRKIDLRVSLLPAVYGESVVVRLLDAAEGLWNLDQLELTPADRQRLDDVMARSHGMFLATGPTGCGKSTTLYAMLLELRRERINILTIEDPVEFHIAGIQQMQVNRAAGFTFDSAMRNFLRHDPDVIMVGEVRDRETAGIAVESALTGHLVLSTLHTNTAATTVTRLLDLGVEPYLLRASLLAVISQRLVRLTCVHCRVPETPDPHIRATLGAEPEEPFFIGRGCAQCEGLGVHKRRAVYELMVVGPGIQRLIVPGAEADTIHQVAVAEGMVPITQAALQLAREGKISLKEAWRVRAD